MTTFDNISQKCWNSIFKERKHKDTIWLIKKLDNILKITIKLNTVKYGKKYKNSIIQMQYLDDKRIINYINTNRVFLICIDNNKLQVYNMLIIW